MAAKKASVKKAAKPAPKKAPKKIVDRSAEILKRLKVLYPVAICELTHENAFQLLSVKSPCLWCGLLRQIVLLEWLLYYFEYQ